MKHTVISTIIMLLASLHCIGQSDFKWEKIDSINKNKNQLYSDTKLFIAENWKSAKDVIHHEDRESGIIFIRGSIKKIAGSGLRTSTCWYSYDVKFYVKNEKYKIIIENLEFVSSDKLGFTAEVANQYPGGWKCSISNKAWNELMNSLKADMENILESYSNYISKPSESKNDW